MQHGDGLSPDDDVIDFSAMTPEQVMEAIGVSRARALELIAIEKGDWAGDVMVIDDDGLAYPEHHGEAWQPGPGEKRNPAIRRESQAPNELERP
jgi:hypothetical protein